MAQDYRVVKLLEKGDHVGEEEDMSDDERGWKSDWPTLDSAKVEGKGNMGLKEIVVESTRLIKVKARELAPFVLVLSSAVAVVFCFGIVELHGLVWGFHRAVYFYSGTDSYRDHLAVSGAVALASFHLLAVCTTLLVAAPFRTHVATEAAVDLGYVIDKFRKLLVTSVMSALLIGVVVSICLAVTVVGLPRIVAGTVMTAFVAVQVVGFALWLGSFLVSTTLTTAVVVLERRWAVDAMVRSAKLVGGKRVTAAGLVILDVIAAIGICTLVVVSTKGPTWVQLVGFVVGVASTMGYWLWFTTIRTVLYVCCVAQYKVERGGLPVVGSAT